MAFTGRKVFTAGEVLTASNMNSLVDQSVMNFADASARSTAISTPTEGMVTYLQSTNVVYVYDGSAWTAIGADTVLTDVLMSGQTRESHVTSGTGFAGYTF